jgi:hypothetical protein
MTEQERPLTEVLDAADAHKAWVDTQVATRPADYAKPMPPQEGVPPHSVQAHKNISIYGEAYATFLEKSGDEVLSAAQEYKDYCYRLAEAAREEYKSEADRASKFIQNIQKRAMTLDAVARGAS